jgi:hypothetical protein
MLFAPDKNTYGIGKKLRIELEDKMSVPLQECMTQ